MNFISPKPMQIRNTKLKKETLQLNLLTKKKKSAVSWELLLAGALQLNGSMAVWKAGIVGRAPSGHERVTGAGSTQGFLQWSLAGAGIFQRSGCSQRGAQAVPACPPPWNLPTGSSFRLEEGQPGSQQGQCLARIIVLGGKQQAGWVSVLPWTGIHGKTIAGRRSHINEAVLTPDFCENKGKPGCMRLLFSWGILFHRKKQCQTSESVFLVGTSFSSLGRIWK